MRKISSQFPANLQAGRLKQAFAPVILFFASLLIAALLPANLFAQAPTITSFSPASGAAGTLVTVNGTNLGTQTAFTIGGQSAIVVSNTGSKMAAMVMPGASTGTISIITAAGSASSSGNFTTTATKYPSAQQGSKLVGTGYVYTIGAVYQGWSVSLSADGNTAIIGGPYDNGTIGAAWVYTRSGGTWSQQGSKLVGTGNVGVCRQGISVSISADGNTAIVGGCFDNGEIGAAWVFTRSGSSWTQQGSKLVGTGYVGSPLQGSSVSLSADGNTAIVGGSADNEGIDESAGIGAAWIYTRSGSTWAQQGSKLVGTGVAGSYAQQGYSVSLSADGNTAMVGGPEDNSAQGAAWVYTRSGGTWTQQGSKLVGTGNSGAADQGWSVSLSADGNTAILGGPFDNTTSGVGAAWIFTRGNGTWIQQGSKLVGTGSIDEANQGASVSISADGNTAIVGGYEDGPEGSLGEGAVWVYTRSGGEWTQQGSKLVGTGGAGTAVYQGWSASLSADGNTAIEGGYGDNPTGAAWVFTISSNALLSTIKLTPSSTLTNTGTTGLTTTYTTSVSNATASVTVTPTAQDLTATIKVNGTTVTSGTASGLIALAEGATTTITTVVTAQDGTTIRMYIINVTRAKSSNALLSSIKLTPSSALTNTGTVGTTTTYTTTAVGATTSVIVTPTTADPNATVKVNGIVVTSGTPSAAIALAFGQTTINTVVTAQNGTTTRIYSIIVTRLSNNALLSTIKLTPASTLTNTGTVGTTTTYTTTASSATASVTVTPTAADANAKIKVNGVSVASGTASGSIALPFGQTIITTVVTAQDGTANRTYSITVTRLSNNALLSSIKLTPSSTLTNTGTSGSTTTYTTSVSNAETSMTITPTAVDANATVKVNGVAVASGTASGSIPLSAGSNTINTIVTAQDGTTTRTYSITVTRATGALMSLYLPVSVVQPAERVSIENDGIMVHQGVSPNGDGINDFLTIDGIIAYPDNSLQIIDRNGKLIYQAKGYNNISNVFDGHSGINGRMQQPGTYFYSLDYVADGQNKHKTGYIILKY